MTDVPRTVADDGTVLVHDVIPLTVCRLASIDPDMPFSSRERFVQETYEYVKTHERWNELTKDEVLRETLLLLVGDIGAAQAFLDAIGVKVDLYA